MEGAFFIQPNAGEKSYLEHREKREEPNYTQKKKKNDRGSTSPDGKGAAFIAKPCRKGKRDTDLLSERGDERGEDAFNILSKKRKRHTDEGETSHKREVYVLVKKRGKVDEKERRIVNTPRCQSFERSSISTPRRKGKREKKKIPRGKEGVGGDRPKRHGVSASKKKGESRARRRGKGKAAFS